MLTKVYFSLNLRFRVFLVDIYLDLFLFQGHSQLRQKNKSYIYIYMNSAETQDWCNKNVLFF